MSRPQKQKPYTSKKHQEIDSSKIVSRGTSVRGDTQRDFDKALRTFSKKVQDDGIIKDARDREHFTKPSEKRRIARKAAKNRSRRESSTGEAPRLY